MSHKSYRQKKYQMYIFTTAIYAVLLKLLIFLWNLSYFGKASYLVHTFNVNIYLVFYKHHIFFMNNTFLEKIISPV